MTKNGNHNKSNKQYRSLKNRSVSLHKSDRLYQMAAMMTQVWDWRPRYPYHHSPVTIMSYQLTFDMSESNSHSMSV